MESFVGLLVETEWHNPIKCDDNEIVTEMEMWMTFAIHDNFKLKCHMYFFKVKHRAVTMLS